MKCRLFIFLLASFILLSMSGCAGRRAFERGEDFFGQGSYDLAVAEYSEAASANPDRQEFRLRLLEARTMASRQHLEAGRQLRGTGEFAAAMAEFEQVVALDPSNHVGRQEMKKTREKLRGKEQLDKARQFAAERKFSQAREILRQVLIADPGNPTALALLAQIEERGRIVLDGFDLDVASDNPITLKFKDADIRDVFNIVSKLSGINFLFDEDIRAQKISILLENATFAQALEVLLRLNTLERKILNAKTILIYPKTKEKEKKFEDQIIQTFYLSNIDAKKAVNLLRTLLQLRKVYVHEELNALVVRETPEVIRLAEQILEAADRADSEVVFDLELVEIAHTDSLDFGPRLSSYSSNIGLAESGAETIGAIITDNLSSLKVLYSVPSATFSLQKTLSDSEILANPKIRVKNKEKAKVHIGSREPIITNTLTSTGDVTSTNVQYVDVGVKLDVEPVIQLDNTVVTKLSLEVSSVTSREPISGGGEALTIGTTNAQTSLILQDGEQTIIGGLIRDDFTKTRNTIPFFGQIPLLGDLISGNKRDKIKREIVLSITPHIVKNVEMPRADVATIWSGGEDDLEVGPRFGSFAQALEPVASMAPPAPAPGMRPLAAPPAANPVPLIAPTGDEALLSSNTSMPEAVDETLDLSAISLPDAGLSAAPAVEPAALPVPAPLPMGIPEENPGKIQMLGPSQVEAGEEFAVFVNVQGARGLYSAPLFVVYDPQGLEFLSAQEGDFLRADNQATIFTTSPSAGKGQVIIGYKQGVGGEGAAAGEGWLFSLNFRAKAPGSAAIALDRLNFLTAEGNRLLVAGAATTVEVR